MRPATHDPDRLLGWLTVSALAAATLATAFVVITTSATARWLAPFVLVTAIAVVWGRQRSHSARVRRMLSLALMLVSTVLWAVSVGPLLIPLQLVALVLLVSDWSVRAGVVGWLGLTVMSLVLYLVVGRRWPLALIESAGIAALMGFGLVFAILLRALTAARAHDRASMLELDAANARLSHSLDIEKELVLADERARMSRELHDGLGHRLTLVSMRLELATRLAATEPDAALTAVNDSRTLVVESIDAMRMWVRALNPIREPGLTGRAAMDAIAGSFRTTGLAVELHGDGDPSQLGEAASLLGYRVVQEGLTNVLRHCGTRQVDIELTDAFDATGRPGLQISVTNPLDAPSVPDRVIGKGGFGLRSLAERAEDLGGSLSAGAEGDQFVLKVWLPKPGANDESSRQPSGADAKRQVQDRERDE